MELVDKAENSSPEAAAEALKTFFRETTAIELHVSQEAFTHGCPMHRPPRVFPLRRRPPQAYFPSGVDPLRRISPQASNPSCISPQASKYRAICNAQKKEQESYVEKQAQLQDLIKQVTIAIKDSVQCCHIFLTMLLNIRPVFLH